jgi:asparagine synthase (glutamine-hydrolysing)
MASRGPDGRGVWWSRDGSHALGHVRLATRDVLGGAQPMSNEDGTIVATVNGELYGGSVLREELTRRGHRLRSRSDSELVVHLYEEHGDDMLRMLRGEFAFVLYDARRRRALAARDAFGIKPLVVAELAGGWAFASQCKALFAMGVPARWDATSLRVALSLQYLPVGRTLFAGIATLAPGHAAIVDAGGMRTMGWARAPSVTTPMAPEVAAHELARHLEQAVIDRLEADVPVAFQLSGGIDSAAVLACARPHVAELAAFSVTFPGHAEDERAAAQACADHLGARLHLVAATPAALADATPAAVVAGEGLAINAHLPAKWLLARALGAAGYRVVMTGEGADELLYGYPHLQIDAGADPALAALSNDVARGLMMPAPDAPTQQDGRCDGAEAQLLQPIQRCLGFVPTFLRAKAAIGARVLRCLETDFLVQGNAIAAGRELLAGPCERLPPGLDRASTAARVWTELALGGYILATLGDGMEMAHGVEGRLPFLDDKVAEFLAGLAPSLKTGDHGNKRLLRMALAERLPRSTLERPKQPFVAPSLTGPMLALARDAFASVPSAGVIHREAALGLIGDLEGAALDERRVVDAALWLLLSLALLGSGLGVAE